MGEDTTRKRGPMMRELNVTTWRQFLYLAGSTWREKERDKKSREITVGCLFFEGCKFCGFRDFFNIRENYFYKNQIIMVQDDREYKFVKLIFRQFHKIYSPQKDGKNGYKE